MKRIQGFLIATVLAGTFSAQGGFENGNGGDLLVCEELRPGEPGYNPAGRPRTQLLDYSEGKERWGFVYDLGGSGIGELPLEKLVNTFENRKPILDDFIARIAKFSPRRASIYKSVLGSFFENARFTDEELIDIPDSFHVSMPRKCQLIQFGILTWRIFEEESKYVISRYWWEQFPTGIGPVSSPGGNAQDAAGLMIHETILEEAISMEQNDSVATRYFHSYIASSKFHSLTQEKFDVLVRRAGLDSTLK